MNINENNIPFDDPEFQISLYMDGDLSGEERVAFERRLESDPALREMLDAYLASERMIESLSDDVPELDTESFVAEAARMRASVDEETPGIIRFARWFGPLVAAAAVAFAFVWSMGDGGGESPGMQVVSRVEVGPPAMRDSAVVAVSYRQATVSETHDMTTGHRSRVLILTSHSVMEADDAEYFDESPIF